jgi:hypothetical protein
MRDISGDLQDRANVIAEQISAVQGQFDKHIEQLKREHEARLEDLKSALDTVHMVIGIEGQRLSSSPSVTKAQYSPSAQSHPRAQQAQPQQPLSDSLLRKVSSVGVR